MQHLTDRRKPAGGLFDLGERRAEAKAQERPEAEPEAEPGLEAGEGAEVCEMEGEPGPGEAMGGGYYPEGAEVLPQDEAQEVPKPDEAAPPAPFQAGLGVLPLVEPARPPVDLAEVERRDRENTLALLQAKTARGVPLKAHEKKELRRLQAAQDGRKLVASLDELASALGVSLRTVKYWAAEEGFPIEDEELYDVERVAAWRAARPSGNHRAKVGEEEEDGEDVDWVKVKEEYAARRERLRFETDRGLLIPRADVERIFAERVVAVSAGLLALPRIAVPLLHEGLSPQEKEAVLDGLARNLLENYSRPLPKELLQEVSSNG